MLKTDVRNPDGTVNTSHWAGTIIHNGVGMCPEGDVLKVYVVLSGPGPTGTMVLMRLQNMNDWGSEVAHGLPFHTSLETLKGVGHHIAKVVQTDRR